MSENNSAAVAVLLKSVPRKHDIHVISGLRLAFSFSMRTMWISRASLSSALLGPYRRCITLRARSIFCFLMSQRGDLVLSAVVGSKWQCVIETYSGAVAHATKAITPTTHWIAKAMRNARSLISGTRILTTPRARPWMVTMKMIKQDCSGARNFTGVICFGQSGVQIAVDIWIVPQQDM